MLTQYCMSDNHRFLTHSITAQHLYAEHGQGVHDADIPKRLQYYGCNEIDVRMPSLGRMFAEEVLLYSNIQRLVWCVCNNRSCIHSMFSKYSASLFGCGSAIIIMLLH